MAQLHDILLEAGVQETFADKLRDDGWNMDLFAMCASNPDGFRDELPDMLGTFHPITTSIQRSALYWPGIDVASVCGSNQQSGAKPAINSTGIYDSGIQLVRDVSAQQRFCCRRPCLHSATVSHAPSEIEERIQMGPMEIPVKPSKIGRDHRWENYEVGES